jgi:acetyl esterase/lipase
MEANENKIFVAGHSAGGHLAALVSLDPSYFDSLNTREPLSGTVLIDAFGLDMFGFLSNETLKKHKTYYAMFGRDPKYGKMGRRIFHLHEK